MTNNRKSKINETNIDMYLGTKIKEYVVEALANAWEHENMMDMSLTDHGSLVITSAQSGTLEFSMSSDVEREDLNIKGNPIGFLALLAYKTHVVIKNGYITQELFIDDAVFQGEVTLKEALDVATFKKLDIHEYDDTLTKLIKGIINESRINVPQLIEEVPPTEINMLKKMYSTLQNGSGKMSSRRFRLWLHHLNAEASITISHGHKSITINEKPRVALHGAKSFKLLTGGGIELGKVHLFVVDREVYDKFANWMNDYIRTIHKDDVIGVSLAKNAEDIQEVIYSNKLHDGEVTNVVLYVSNRPGVTNPLEFDAYKMVYNAYHIKASDRLGHVELEYIKTRQDIQHDLKKPYFIRIANN